MISWGSINRRITLLSIVFFLNICVSGYFGIRGINDMYNSSKFVEERVTPALNTLYFLDRDAHQTLMAQRSELVPGSPQWKKDQKDAFESNFKQVADGWKKYKAMGSICEPEKEQKFKTAFDEKYAIWAEHAQKVHRLVQQGTPASMAEATKLIEENSKLWQDMRNQIDGLESIYEPYLANNVKQMPGYHAKNIYIQIASLICAVILGNGLTTLVKRSIIKPMTKVTNILKDLAEGEGDLTKRLNFKSNDELGVISNLVDTFIEKLHVTVTGIVGGINELASTSQQLLHNSRDTEQAAETVAKAIEQVASGANNQSKNLTDAAQTVGQVSQAIDQIAAGANEQSTNVLMTTEMVADMSAKIDQMVKGMNRVKDVSENNGKIAENGGKSVERTVKGMLQVKEAVFETASKINELGEQSQKIGEIIQVIDDIADQTNLLALNAAIEAARAGEHGKGFAVVADEVRKLAERSGKATKEIAQLINDIQRGTKVAVDSMDVGTKEVEEGVVLAKEAGKSLSEIVEGVKAANQQVNQIMSIISDLHNSSQKVNQAVSNVAAITEENSASTQEMAASTDQVNNSIQNIAAIAEESAAAAEEVSASTEEMTASLEQMSAYSEQLAQLAESLRSVVNQFKV